MKKFIVFYELSVSVLVICLCFSVAPLLGTYGILGMLTGFLALAFFFCMSIINIFGYVLYIISIIFGEKK